MTTPVPESGSLADAPVPRTLLQLYASRFTGRLELVRGRTHKVFTLQDGALVAAESSVPAEALTAILQDSGCIDRGQRSQVQTKVRKSGCGEAAALLQLGLLEPKQLFDAMREQIRRSAIECFGWVDGEYKLEPSQERSEELKAFRADPFRLVQDGLQNHWSLDRMFEALAPRMTQYASSSTRLGKVARRLTLDATVERMIASLSGKQTLGSVIGSAAGSPGALAAFWVLDAANCLNYSDSQRAAEGEDAGTEIEIHIVEEGASPAADSSPAAPGASKVASAKPEMSAEAEKMRAEVLDRLDRLDSLSFYELLDVDPQVEHAAIRKAYFMAAKRYHPDAIVRLGLGEIRSEAGEVFGKIAEANEVLSDAKRRESYDRQLEGGLPDIDIQVLGQAETFYRKGEILINMGDFRGALEYLKNAVDLYPHECVYQSDLAWAYYKKNPPEPEPALEHIKLALAIDPDDAVAQFRLGVIERDEG